MRHIKKFNDFNINEQINVETAFNYFKGLFGGDSKEDLKPGESPIKGSVRFSSSDKSKAINSIIEAMKKYGVTNPYTQIAILSTIGKESGFVPQNEISYGSTSNERIKKIFGKRVENVDVDSLKKDPVAFFDQIYGKQAEEFLNFDTGNDQPGDGWKYRGRGFNQITFKNGYKKIQKLFDTMGKTKVDLVNNPDKLNEEDIAAEAAVLYFIDSCRNPEMNRKYGVNDINGFKDQETALKAIVNSNAGWGNSLEGKLREDLEKAKSIATTFKIDNSKEVGIA